MGSKVQIVQIGSNTEPVERLSSVRTVSDQYAQPIHITRDPDVQTSGTFLHETVSEALFTEINNVMDVNRFLFPGRNRFLMGSDVYYRIYSERRKVKQQSADFEMLLFRGLADYLPFLFWCTKLSDATIAAHLADLVLLPKGKDAYSLSRVAPLLGNDFCEWLLSKFKKKWGKYSQPPAVYWQIEKLSGNILTSDRRLIASRMGPSSLVPLTGDKQVLLSEVLAEENYLEDLVSRACLEVFNGEKQFAEVARNFDYLAHGRALTQRDLNIASTVKDIVGDRLPNILDG